MKNLLIIELCLVISLCVGCSKKQEVMPENMEMPVCKTCADKNMKMPMKGDMKDKNNE